MRRQELAFGVAALAGLMGSTTAWAQAADRGVAARAAEPAGIEELVVTARKREETLQAVPEAITAYSGEQLAQKGVVTPLDLMRVTPGLRSQNHPGGSSIVQFTIRGQAAADIITTIDPAVGVYLDGVYVGRTRGLNAAFYDMERVEVVKGPQGTLYGRNTTGGAVNLITRGADYDGVHGQVSVDAGNHSLKAVHLAANLPVMDDKLAVRVALQRVKREGYGHSLTTGQDFERRNQAMGRLSIRFDPTETFSAQVKWEHFWGRESGLANVPFFVNPAGGAVREVAIEQFGVSNDATNAQALAILQGIVNSRAQHPYDNYANTLQKDDNDADTVGLTLNWKPSDSLYVKSITGYRVFQNTVMLDNDATQYNIWRLGMGVGGIPLTFAGPGSLSGNFTFTHEPDNKNRFFSQELNIGGAAISDRLNWLVGAYYSNETGQDIATASVQPALNPTVAYLDGAKVDSIDWSVFTQNDFKVTDTVSVTLGARYTEEKKGQTSRVSTFFPATGLYACQTGALGANGLALQTSDVRNCARRTDVKFNGVSYLASVDWQVTRDALIYVKTARGFRGGALQLRVPLAAPAEPEFAKDYELGLKSDWFDRRLRANFAAYRTTYSNKQESTTIVVNGAASTVLFNAADAKIKGFEAEFTAIPIEGLTLNANAAYIKGRYGRFPGALPIQGGAAIDASGEKMSMPPWTYGLSARYEFPVGPGDLALNADWSYTAKAKPPGRLLNPVLPAYVINATVPTLYGGGYPNSGADLGLLNGRIDYMMKDQGLTVSVFATNLLDKLYYHMSLSATATGFYNLVAGEPRMWGVSVKKTFGGD